MTGYRKLATFMVEEDHPILRKYEQLAARDLLLLQAELSHLEHRYCLAEKNDSEQQDERALYNLDWELMHTSHLRGFNGEQWNISLEIRAKLREYHDAMLKYARVTSLPQPRAKERSLLHEWIQSPALGGGCGFLGPDLGGFDQPAIYEEKYQKDLVILTDNHGEDDVFTQFVTGPFLRWCNQILKFAKKPLPVDVESAPTGNNKSILYHYDTKQVHVATNVFGTILSSIAPLTSIIALSFVTDSRARLGLICTFTLLFSSCLAVATKARRVEIFAATAAFASVQVVFIGSSNPAC